MHNQQKFLEIINKPYETDKAVLSFLKKVTESYPYCQSAQILLAKNLQQLFKPDFEQQVNKASAYAVNRRKFQRFISDRDKPELINEKPTSPSADPFAQEKELPDTLTSLPEEPEKQTELISEPETPTQNDQVEKPEQIIIPEGTLSISDITTEEVSPDDHPEKKDAESQKSKPAGKVFAEEKKDKLSLLEIVKKRLLDIHSKNQKPTQNDEKEIQLTKPEIRKEEPKADSPVSENEIHHPYPVASKTQQDDKPKRKIPDYIYGKHTKQPDINYLIDKFLKEEPRIKVKKELPEEQEDLSASSTIEDPQLATETLALVYLKQGRKEEALNVYEKLCLKFPEKSSYFAKKILDIKNEINP